MDAFFYLSDELKKELLKKVRNSIKKELDASPSTVKISEN